MLRFSLLFSIALILGSCASQQPMSYSDDDLYYSNRPVLRYNPKPVENQFTDAYVPDADTWYDETTASELRPNYRHRLTEDTSTYYRESTDFNNLTQLPANSLFQPQVGIGMGLGMGYYPGMYSPYSMGYYPYGLWGTGPSGRAPNLYYVNTQRPTVASPQPYRPDPTSRPAFRPLRTGAGEGGGNIDGNRQYRTREGGAESPAWFNNSSRMGGNPSTQPGGRVYGVPRR